MTKVVQPEDMDEVSLAHQKEGEKEKKNTRKVLQRLAYKDADDSVSVDIGCSEKARKRRVFSHKGDNEDYIRDTNDAISAGIAENEWRTRSRTNRWTSEKLRIVRWSAFKERIVSCTSAETYKLVGK